MHIEEHGEEFLVVSNLDRGELVKIPVKNGEINGDIANVVISDPNSYIDGCDGLVRVNDCVLIGTTDSNVVLFETSDNWKTAEIKKVVYIKT